MPRAPSEKVTEAEKLFKKGMAMVDIAKKLGVSDGTVRSWKNRYGWGTDSKKNKCNVAKKDDKKNATLQKKKRGGQPGNTNSKGASKGKGNPHPHPPPDRTKHGAYKKVYWDVLDDEEIGLIEDIPDNAEEMLIEQIQLFSVRERRIMQAINRYRSMTDEVVVADISKEESKRDFKDAEEENEYNNRRQKKIDKGDIMPGKSYGISTHSTNKDLIIARLEQELSTVQSKKTKAIEALSKIRMETKKMESERAGNGAVDDWIAAVLGEDVKDNE